MGMGLILVLWAVPRSRSTAFEQMMRERDDHLCLHEPFGEAWYQGEDRRCPPQHAGELKLGLTATTVWSDLRANAAAGPVFIKEFPHYVSHLIDDNFLDHFNHSFLIRDPALTLPSMSDKWPDFELSETGFAEQRSLFDRLTKRWGKPPPVIDAEDLMAEPKEIVSMWCDAVGIPFRAEALSWTAPKEEAMSWYDKGSWHDNLRASTGLNAQLRDYVPVDHNDALKRAYEFCRPHYEALHAHRLTV